LLADGVTDWLMARGAPWFAWRIGARADARRQWRRGSGTKALVRRWYSR